MKKNRVLSLILAAIISIHTPIATFSDSEIQAIEDSLAYIDASEDADISEPDVFQNEDADPIEQEITDINIDSDYFEDTVNTFDQETSDDTAPSFIDIEYPKSDENNYVAETAEEVHEEISELAGISLTDLEECEKLYAPVLDQYQRAYLEKWDNGKYAESGLPFSTMMYVYDQNSPEIPRPYTIIPGYFFTDLNNDSNPEMLLSRPGKKDSMDVWGYFFAIYTIKDGVPFLVCSYSGYRDGFALLENGLMSYGGSSSSTTSWLQLCKMSDSLNAEDDYYNITFLDDNAHWDNEERPNYIYGYNMIGQEGNEWKYDVVYPEFFSIENYNTEIISDSDTSETTTPLSLEENYTAVPGEPLYVTAVYKGVNKPSNIRWYSEMGSVFGQTEVNGPAVTGEENTWWISTSITTSNWDKEYDTDWFGLFVDHDISANSEIVIDRTSSKPSIKIPDIWSFANWRDEFPIVNGYYMTDHDFRKLMNGLTYIDRKLVADDIYPKDKDGLGYLSSNIWTEHINVGNRGKEHSGKKDDKNHPIKDGTTRRWGGSCYGMSATAILVNNGLLSPSDLGILGNKLSDKFTYGDTASAINFYFFQQRASYAQTVRKKFINSGLTNGQKSQLDELEKLGKQANNTGKCFMIGYEYFKKNAEGKFYSQSRHAVMGYGYEESAEEWIFNGKQYTKRILIYDCSNPRDNLDETHLYYNDKGEFCIPGRNIYSISALAEENSYNNGSLLLVTGNPTDFCGVDYPTGNVDSQWISASLYDYIITKLQDVIIKIRDNDLGQVWTIHRKYTNNDPAAPSVISMSDINGEDSNDEYCIIFPHTGHNYTVTSGDQDLDCSIISDGQMADVETTVSGSITFGPHDDIFVTTDQDAVINLSVTDNNNFGTGDYNTFSIEGNSVSSISVDQSANQIIIQSDAQNGIQITKESESEKKTEKIVNPQGPIFVSLDNTIHQHYPVLISGKDATCTENGYTSGLRCSECGQILEEQKIIPALGHEWNQWMKDSVTSSLTDIGESRTCNRCGAKETRDFDPTAVYMIFPPLRTPIIYPNTVSFFEKKSEFVYVRYNNDSPSQTNIRLQWKSENEKVVKVEGRSAAAVGIGSTYLTATFNGRKYRYHITVKKEDQNVSVTTKTASVKYTKTRKKKLTIKADKVFTVRNAVSTVKFAKVSGSKKLFIKQNGDIIVKKGTKKGTYKIKVRVMADGNNYYSKTEKEVNVKVKVK